MKSELTSLIKTYCLSYQYTFILHHLAVISPSGHSPYLPCSLLVSPTFRVPFLPSLYFWVSFFIYLFSFPFPRASLLKLDIIPSAACGMGRGSIPTSQPRHCSQC